MTRLAILANSGGIDSRVAAAMLRADGWTLHSVYIDWTQLAGQAAAAAETARRYCASHEVLAWPLPAWVIDNPRTGHPTLPQISLCSAILTAVRAESLHADAIAGGTRAEVLGEGWMAQLEALLATNRYRPAKRVLMPVYAMSAREITLRGRSLGVDLDSTWSCTASDPACGTCASCRRRVAEGIAA